MAYEYNNRKYATTAERDKHKMAGISFLDLMFAEALVAGLARDAQRRQERPPPDNFFVLTRDPRAWTQIKEASKKENMVICLEFINEGTSSGAFMDLAREFDSIPFLRVKVGPGLGGTFDEVLITGNCVVIVV